MTDYPALLLIACLFGALAVLALVVWHNGSSVEAQSLPTIQASGTKA